MVKFQARYYASGSGTAVPVEISICDDGYVELVDENHNERFLLSRMELEIGGHAEDRIKLSCSAHGIALVSEDRNLISALAASSDLKISGQAKKALAKISTLGKSGKIYWGKVISITCIALVVSYYLVDLLAVTAITNIDPKTEGVVGKLIASGWKLGKSGPDFDRVNKIGNRLIEHLDKNPYTFTFSIKNDEDINACAYPGGTVVVNKGLLDKASSDDEIAGVIAHEIGHVIHRDTLKRMAHSMGVWAMLQFLLGISNPKDIENIASALKLAGNLESLQYNRSQETAADLMGVKLCVESDYRGDAIIAFFERLQKNPASSDNKIFAILSTHPMNEDRIKTIRAELARLDAARAKKNE